MTWAIEKFRSLNPTRCALVWYERDGKLPSYTVATFPGPEGEAAAERILADLFQHGSSHGPEKWGSSR